MFNFLASQHRVLPEGATCDEEEVRCSSGQPGMGGRPRVLGVVWKGPKRVIRAGEVISGVPAVWPLPSPPDVPPVWSCPLAMRFRHLKKTSKEAVGVYRFVGLWGGCPLGGQAGARVPGLPWFCPPDLPLAHPTLQICHPRAGPVL